MMVAAAIGIAAVTVRRTGGSALAPLGTRGLGAGLAAIAALVFSAIITVNIGLRHMLMVSCSRSRSGSSGALAPS
jgi:hypothetical protein